MTDPVLPDPQFSGRCQCGAVRYRLVAPPAWTALCHCDSCRRAAGAPMVAWMGFEVDQVLWTGTRRFYNSSAKAKRSFCPVCGTQMSFESTAWPGEVHLPAMSLDDPTAYRPQLHCHAGEQLDWLKIHDALPVHQGTAEI